jgi:hypothetical protein
MGLTITTSVTHDRDFAFGAREGDSFQGQKIPVLRFIAERPIE